MFFWQLWQENNTKTNVVLIIQIPRTKLKTEMESGRLDKGMREK